MVAVMFLLCWAPAPFFVSFVWVFLFVALCFWVCVGRYAFLTGGNAFLPNAWICVWFVLFLPPPRVQAFCEFLMISLLPRLFLTERTEPLS